MLREKLSNWVLLRLLDNAQHLYKSNRFHSKRSRPQVSGATRVAVDVDSL